MPLRRNVEIINDILSEDIGSLNNRRARLLHVMKVAFDPDIVKISLSGDEDYYDKMRERAKSLYPELPEGTIERGIFESACNAENLREVERLRKSQSLLGLFQASDEEKGLVKAATMDARTRRMLRADLGFIDTAAIDDTDWREEARTHISATLPLSNQLVDAALHITEAAVILEEAEKRG